MLNWSFVLPLLAILPALLVIYGFARKRLRKPKSEQMGARGKQLLLEQIPIVSHLPDPLKGRFFEQVAKLRKNCTFYIGLGDPPTSEGFVKIKSDEHAIYLGQIALLTLFRPAGFPTQVFPVALTPDIVVQTDPIIQGSLGTAYPRTVMADDVSPNSTINILGLSAFAFQIAKFMDTPDLHSATAVHRQEYHALLDELDKAYREFVLEPAQQIERETGETPEVLSPFGFLLDQQQKFFGSFSEYQTIVPEVRTVLDTFFGKRIQLH
ncbi:MAG: hypothetical protein KDA53_12500 [Hyphomonas sp.]|nr:hypothetical protein [Hyphomonas sp.]